MLRLLVVEDVPQYRKRIERHFTETLSGYAVSSATSRDEALLQLARMPPDLILLDLIVPASASDRRKHWSHGDEILTASRRLTPPPRVIVITTEGQLARDFLKLRGVHDFFAKDLPAAWSDEELPHQVESAIGHLACRSPAMLRLRAGLETPRLDDGLILLTGPPGAGKDHLARVLHLNSPASRLPIRWVHLPRDGVDGLQAALADAGTVLARGVEHVDGLLVADAARLEGLLERAAAGEGPRVCVLADQPVQELAKALRELPRLWSCLSAARRFAVPRLAERMEDLAELVDAFRREAAIELGLNVRSVKEEAVATIAAAVRGGLLDGEARGLRALVREAVATATGDTIEPDHLCIELPVTHRVIECRAGSIDAHPVSTPELRRLLARPECEAVLSAGLDGGRARVVRVRVDSRETPVEDERLGRMLYLLASAPGEIVALEERWRETGLLEREEVRRYIYRLRRLLDGSEDGESRRFIRSHRGEGYSFRSDVDYVLVTPLEE